MIDIYWILFAIPSIIVASTVHEFAHGYTAFKLGDPTAKAEGRLTLNPLAHIDPIGALSMIFLRFGWSKPVPINEYNFENRERDTALVSLAGPLSNIGLLLLTALLNFILKPAFGGLLNTFLITFAMVNISLAIFNLLPIPPLDGHKIVRAFLGKKLGYYWDRLERFSFILIIIMIIPILPSGQSIASTVISQIMTKTLLTLGFF